MIHIKSVGRPPTVDYKVIKKLECALHFGHTVTRACSYAGISRDTYYRYLRADHVFAERIKKARRKPMFDEYIF